MEGESTILCSRPPDLYTSSKLIRFVLLPARFFLLSSSCAAAPAVGMCVYVCKRRDLFYVYIHINRTTSYPKTLIW